MRTRSLAPLLLPLSLLGLLTGCGTGPPENAALVQECVVANATVTSARTPIDRPMARAGRVLLYQYPADHYALLEVPGCKVTSLSDDPGVGQLRRPSAARRWFTHGAGQRGEPARAACLSRFAQIVGPLVEEAVPSAIAACEPVFRRLGLTDAGIARTAHPASAVEVTPNHSVLTTRQESPLVTPRCPRR